jgi:class 3 adenylate cyclase
MQQMADWLEKLGMSEYAERFAENDIDTSVLRHLTDQDLKELGVSLGRRRKMLAAIAELAGAVSISPQPALIEPKAHDAAERRQVTVMFSDLVGSTALSARMDPEDLREVISAYQKCVGFVAKYLGDGVLVYFGYPHAHEDDAERAVRAGLQLIATVAGLKTRVSLQTRVGIATGLVVVGDLIGSGEAQERGIVGETPNLAARLQGIAEPNMVVIADGTRRLLGNLFELEDLGAKDLKGIAGPVRAWGVLRASSAEGRFEALHARTRPMARCCASRDAHFTPASPKQSKPNSPRSLRTSRRSWRVAVPRPGWSKRVRCCGAKRDSGRWSGRRWLKQQSSSGRLSIRSRHCPPRLRCVASRLTFRSRS